MFGKLQEDAARIDTEIATLESKLPEVMYGYTDRNPEPQPIVERRAHDNTRIQCEMQTFLAEVAAFEKLLDENSEETAEEERFVRQVAQERQLEHLLVQDDESDANLTVSLLDCPSSPNVDSDDRRDSVSPPDRSPHLFIAKSGRATATFTPAALRTSEKKLAQQRTGINRNTALQTRLRF